MGLFAMICALVIVYVVIFEWLNFRKYGERKILKKYF